MQARADRWEVSNGQLQPLPFSFAYLELSELPFFFLIKTHCFLFIPISASVSQFVHTQN